MFNISLAIFDIYEDNPSWSIKDEEAINILDIDQKLVYSESTYDDSDEFEDNMPLGYQGFSIEDLETANYWRLKGNTVFKFGSTGVLKAIDTECCFENYLRKLVKNQSDLWYALSEPFLCEFTKCVERDKD